MQAKGKKVIGLLGSLEKRKGVLTFIELSQQAMFGDKWYFILAGKLARNTFNTEELTLIDNFISANPDNCFLFFDYIKDEADFNALINVCDLIFAVYEKFPHSSNILTKAAIFQKPVIVSGGYYMAELVNEYKLGWTVEERNCEQCLNVMRYFEEHENELIDDFHYHRFTIINSEESLVESFNQILQMI